MQIYEIIETIVLYFMILSGGIDSFGGTYRPCADNLLLHITALVFAIAATMVLSHNYSTRQDYVVFLSLAFFSTLASKSCSLISRHTNFNILAKVILFFSFAGIGYYIGYRIFETKLSYGKYAKKNHTAFNLIAAAVIRFAAMFATTYMFFRDAIETDVDESLSISMEISLLFVIMTFLIEIIQLMQDKREREKDDEAFEKRRFEQKETEIRSSCSIEELDELEAMIGLDNVKEKLKVQITQQKAASLKRLNGIYEGKSSPLHMVFIGEPGTGKTVCARLLAKAYLKLGALNRDCFIECSRGELVGGAAGESARKTKSVIEEAMGGVLFVDEAYTICYGPHDQLGKEALDVLMKSMEDHKEDLCVILAGYTEEMTALLKENPGLLSRIPEQNILYFENYTTEELVLIFRHMVRESGYRITNEKLFQDIAKRAVLAKFQNEGFGNARGIRNLCDQLIKIKNDTIVEAAEEGESLTRQELTTITEGELYRFMRLITAHN